MLAIAGQPTGSHHSPKSLFLYEKTRLIRQCVSEPVMLMVGVNHNVGAIQRRPVGIMIQKRAARSEDIP